MRQGRPLPDQVPFAPPAAVEVTAFAALSAAGVRWCRLRAAAEEPGDDVDLLVHPEDVAAAARALTAAGLRELYRWAPGGHRFFLAFDPAELRWVKLDVVDRVSFGRYGQFRGVPTEPVLRRRTAGPVPEPAPQDRFWLLLAHELLDRTPPPRRQRAELLAGLAPEPAQLDGPVAATVVGHAGPTWAGAAVEAARRRDHAALGRLGTELAAAWRRRGNRVDTYSLGQRIRWRWERTRPGTSRGLVVAVVGADGAGKTTLVRALDARLPVPTSVVPLSYRPWNGWLGRVPGRVAGPKLRSAVSGAARAAAARGRGEVVLLDRYDHPVAAAGPPLRAVDRLAGRVASLVPPDAVIALRAPAAELLARKGEHDTDILTRRQEAFVGYARTQPRHRVIDTDRRLDGVVADALAAVWDWYVGAPGPAAPRRRR